MNNFNSTIFSMGEPSTVTTEAYPSYNFDEEMDDDESSYLLSSYLPTEVDQQVYQEEILDLHAAANRANTSVANTSVTSRSFQNTERDAAVVARWQASKERQQSKKEDNRKNRNYTTSQITKLLTMIEDQCLSVKKAAVATGIVLPTAYYYHLKYLRNGREFPERKTRGPRKSDILKEEHLLFVTNLVDECGQSTLDSLREKMMIRFPEVKISKSAFYRFIKNECAFSFKKIEKVVEYRCMQETIDKRRITVQSWMDNPELKFDQNCVFLDESGFNMHMCRSGGWSDVGRPCKTMVAKSRGKNVTILGAISHTGFIHLAVRKQVMEPATSKKRKVNGEPVQVQSLVGTRTVHFLKYLSELMDKLDFEGLKGYHLVMDNAPIHKSKEVQEAIISRGYKLIYLPTYSPFLNPVEELWSKVKYGVKRRALDTGDDLATRIVEAASLVTAEDINGWIRHSISFFPKCLNGDKL